MNAAGTAAAFGLFVLPIEGFPSRVRGSPFLERYPVFGKKNRNPVPRFFGVNVSPGKKKTSPGVNGVPGLNP